LVRNLVLVLLQSLIRLAVLTKSVAAKVRGSLRRVTASGAGSAASAAVAALLARLDGVDFAVREFGLLDALVGLAVLAETVVFCG
jgi:hypothetical protein